MSPSTQAAVQTFNEETQNSLKLALDGSTDVSLLDFPSYMNVGDSMIWAGERTYLKAMGVTVHYACDIERYSAKALEKSHPSSVILLQGGGNLGDLWPSFQEFREKVVRDFPERKIIQLPQTLHFESPAAARKANEIFGAHPDLTVMLRDGNSMQRAAHLLPSVRTVFVRDMALGWDPKVSGSNQTRGILILARRDAEAAGSTASLQYDLHQFAEVEVADWGLDGLRHVKWKASKIPGGIVRQVAPLKDSPTVSKLLGRSYNRMLDMNLEAGIGLFENRRLIVTDRLHAHVLASLMNIPHIVMDNSYGKIKSIFDDYTHKFSCAHFAGSNQEAKDLAVDLLNSLEEA